jgi:hypothetical protein
MPDFICEYVFNNCIAASPNNATLQGICKSEAETFCAGFGSATVISTFNGMSLTIFQAGAATTSHSSTSVSSTITSSSTQSQSASTPVSPPVENKSGISSGTLGAVIAVPVVVVVLVALGYGTFVYRTRKAAKAASGTGQPEGYAKAELHGEPVPPAELPMQERFELHGDGVHNEIAGDEPQVHEVGTTSPS